MYLRTIQLRDNLEIVGVTDLVRERAEIFAKYANCQVFESCDHMLDSANIDTIVNLTNPRAHYEVNRAALLAGKHVYCEKPLAMEFAQAKELVELAQKRDQRLSGAPCNVLSEAAQALWRSLRRNAVGVPRLVYAEMDDGMVPRSPYQKWFNEFGVPWPAKDEFEVGCTMEHAGYALTWLSAFFGPAESVHRFGADTIPNKYEIEPLEKNSPDFTVACIRFRSGIVARLTCSIVAPHDHRIRIIGDDGILSARDCWKYRTRVKIERRINIRRRSLLVPWGRPLPLPPPPVGKISRFGHATMDFARGIAELADAIRMDRPCRLSPEFCLHTNELALAINSVEKTPDVREIKTKFDPVEPMPWTW